jgi:hypothetical protein
MAEELAGAWQRYRDYLALLARLQMPARLRQPGAEKRRT